MCRPEKKIDWVKVDHLLMAGCEGVEIAPHFDMHVKTFYERIKDHYSMTFTEYCALKRCHGDSLLRAKQFEKALKGDNVQLIWLGKQRLNQREPRSEDFVVASEQEQKNHDALMKQLEGLRNQSDSNIEENNSNIESQS